MKDLYNTVTALDSFIYIYKKFGSRGVLMEWPSLVDISILEEVSRVRQIVQTIFKNAELIPAYNSLAILFGEEIDYDAIVKSIEEELKKAASVTKAEKTLWRIPVCYDKEFGVDLEEFCLAKGMDEEEVIELHTQAVYTVFCIGFLPGFLYLGGLDHRLHHPRRSEPRLKIPRGSVGIGGEQTGIYPQASPGGWNIIGNSAVKIFDARQEDPCPVKVGDRVQFYSVSKAEHELVSIQVDSGVFKLEGEKL